MTGKKPEYLRGKPTLIGRPNTTNPHVAKNRGEKSVFFNTVRPMRLYAVQVQHLCVSTNLPWPGVELTNLYMTVPHHILGHGGFTE